MLDIKTEFVETHKEYDDTHGQDIPKGIVKKWVSVDSLLAFVDNYDYYDYLVEALKEELEEK